MERGFVRIIMAVVFSVLIAISFTACGDCNGTCENNNSAGENENGDDGGGGDDNGGGESPALPSVITLDSVDSNGNEGTPSLSADGRYVAFRSDATNLVANDTKRKDDIFVHDRQNGETTRVSVDSNGNEANNHSCFPSISADGHYVAFQSWATNLVAIDNPNYIDIFTAPVP
jgi:hypothetical protein